MKIEIHDIGSSGEGVGYAEGLTWFIEGALPGEEIEAEVLVQKKSYGRAQIKEIIKKSPHRAVPPCPYYTRCGGCQLMHLEYSQQLKMKKKRVVDALERVGKIENPPVHDCVPSPKQLAYRNKIQLQKGFGYYARGSNTLVEVDHCAIHNEIGEEVYKNIHTLVAGKVRHLLIKTAMHSKQVLIVLVTDQMPTPNLKAIAKKIKEQPFVAGVVHNLNQSEGNVVLGKKYYLLEGVDTIEENICGLTFNISPASFFQVNKDQAENLYAKAIECADLKGDEVVFDAYCGVGTLSLLAAKHAKKVIGVECVPEAIADAKMNAKANAIANVEFICGMVEKTTLPSIDVALINPPRKGMDAQVIEQLGKLKPKKLVYVSCNPATLARDLKELISHGYQFEGAYPFDMFPQTAHVEVVAKLSQR